MRFSRDLKLNFGQDFEAGVWVRFWSCILVKFLSCGLVKTLRLKFGWNFEAFINLCYNLRAGILVRALNPYIGPLCLWHWRCFVSSVRSSNSHPDLLVIQHPTHFFRSHRSSTLDFHFLSHYSYIKSNHWTHRLATCIPYGYNRTSLQDSAR